MKLNRNQIKISLYSFFLSIFIIIFFIIIDSIIFQKNLNENLMTHAYKELNRKNIQFKEVLKEQENLLYSIKNSSHFKNYLTNENYYKDEMNEFFSIITSNKKNIMQLRYINKDGLEKIKVTKESVDSMPIINFNSNLENKSDRYYYKKSIENPDEKVWFTNLDLNIKNGQIQIPYRATLRAVLPIIKNNQFEGLLIVNYFMDNIINKLFESTFFDMILINKKGFSLYHYDSSKIWGYYQEPKFSIKNDFKNTFKEIISKDILIADNFISTQLKLPTLEQLILIVKIKESFTQEQSKSNYRQYIYVSFIVIIVSLLISFLFSNYLEKLFNTLNKTLKINKSLDEKLENIIENINDFVWEVDKDWRYTYISPQIKDILGYEPRELIGKTPFELMPKDEAIRVKELLKEKVKNKEFLVQIVNINLYKKKKKKIYLETNATPRVSKDGDLLGYRGIDRDITNKIEQENKIKEMNKKLELANLSLKDKIKEEIEKNKLQEEQLFNQAKMAAMGDMIGNIAHQWRQPLNYISVIASGVKLDQELGLNKNEQIPESMKQIIDKTQYLSKTIDTFRNFLKEKKEYEEVIIQSRIDIALNIVEASIKDNHIEILNNINYIVPVRCHIVKSELAEVIINIFNNAKDALIEKEIENPWIKIDLEDKKESVNITIEDNAGGIPTNIINRVFEPYFTTKDTNKGTGLGLYMSYKIITESLKGKLLVENSENGAKFVIEIPKKIKEK